MFLTLETMKNRLSRDSGLLDPTLRMDLLELVEYQIKEKAKPKTTETYVSYIPFTHQELEAKIKRLEGELAKAKEANIRLNKINDADLKMINEQHFEIQRLKNKTSDTERFYNYEEKVEKAVLERLKTNISLEIGNLITVRDELYKKKTSISRWPEWVIAMLDYCIYLAENKVVENLEKSFKGQAKTIKELDEENERLRSKLEKVQSALH